jgi:hypothetical protein
MAPAKDRQPTKFIGHRPTGPTDLTQAGRKYVGREMGQAGHGRDIGRRDGKRSTPVRSRGVAWRTWLSAGGSPPFRADERAYPGALALLWSVLGAGRQHFSGRLAADRRRKLEVSWPQASRTVSRAQAHWSRGRSDERIPSAQETCQPARASTLTWTGPPDDAPRTSTKAPEAGLNSLNSSGAAAL